MDTVTQNNKRSRDHQDIIDFANLTEYEGFLGMLTGLPELGVPVFPDDRFTDTGGGAPPLKKPPRNWEIIVDFYGIHGLDSTMMNFPDVFYGQTAAAARSLIRKWKKKLYDNLEVIPQQCAETGEPSFVLSLDSRSSSNAEPKPAVRPENWAEIAQFHSLYGLRPTLSAYSEVFRGCTYGSVRSLLTRWKKRLVAQQERLEQQGEGKGEELSAATMPPHMMHFQPQQLQQLQQQQLQPSLSVGHPPFLQLQGQAQGQMQRPTAPSLLEGFMQFGKAAPSTAQSSQQLLLHQRQDHANDSSFPGDPGQLPPQRFSASSSSSSGIIIGSTAGSAKGQRPDNWKEIAEFFVTKGLRPTLEQYGEHFKDRVSAGSVRALLRRWKDKLLSERPVPAALCGSSKQKQLEPQQQQSQLMQQHLHHHYQQQQQPSRAVSNPQMPPSFHSVSGAVAYNQQHQLHGLSVYDPQALGGLAFLEAALPCDDRDITLLGQQQHLMQPIQQPPRHSLLPRPGQPIPASALMPLTYGKQVEDELLQLVLEVMNQTGQSFVDNKTLRDLLLGLLRKHNKEYLLVSNGGKNVFGRSWAQRFRERHDLQSRPTTCSITTTMGMGMGIAVAGTEAGVALTALPPFQQSRHITIGGLGMGPPSSIQSV